MAKHYVLGSAVRGELRIDGRVVTYDLPAGPVPANTDPEVIGRLVASGVATVAPRKSETKEN